MIRSLRMLTLAVLVGFAAWSVSPAQEKNTKTDTKKTDSKTDTKKADPKTDSKTEKKTDKKSDTKTEKKVTGPVFELYVDSAGEYRFRFKDADGLLLASSGKGYKTKADCMKTIDAIQKDAAKAKLDDQAKDK